MILYNVISLGKGDTQMPPSAYLYCEICFISIIIFAIILIHSLLNAQKTTEDVIFICITACLIVVCVFDALWGLAESGTISSNRFFNYLYNYFYYFFTVFAAGLWFVYSERMQDEKIFKTKKGLFAVVAIFVAVAFFIALTAFTKLVFYIDQDNHYQRGKLFFLPVAVIYSFWSYSAIKALVKSLNKQNYMIRSRYFLLSLFTVIQGLFTLIQNVGIHNLPTQCIGSAFMLLLVHLNHQNILITVDPMTKLNNRSQMLRYLSHKFNAKSNGKSLYLLMVDADGFKAINDINGHIEGDSALIRIADVLKSAVPHDYHISRYGGDEFTVIGEAEKEQDIVNLCNDIYGALAEYNEQSTAPYDLSVSIGYAKKSETTKTIADLIFQADTELYKEKKRKFVNADFLLGAKQEI